jgi:protein SCO1/2
VRAFPQGRLAAKFHGLRFDPVNLILYVNGLINNAHMPGPPDESWWEFLLNWIRPGR